MSLMVLTYLPVIFWVILLVKISETNLSNIQSCPEEKQISPIRAFIRCDKAKEKEERNKRKKKKAKQNR